MDQWPTLDFIATNFHFVSNLIIVIMAWSFETNGVMLLNIIIVAIFYPCAARRLVSVSQGIKRNTGILTQCDLKMAEKVTRIYKRESSKVFLEYRNVAWNILTTINILALLLAYPTPLLYYIYRYKNFEGWCSDGGPDPSSVDEPDAAPGIRPFDCGNATAGSNNFNGYTFPSEVFTDPVYHEEIQSWLDLLGIYKVGAATTDYNFYRIRLTLLLFLFIEK